MLQAFDQYHSRTPGEETVGLATLGVCYARCDFACPLSDITTQILAKVDQRRAAGTCQVSARRRQSSRFTRKFLTPHTYLMAAPRIASRLAVPLRTISRPRYSCLPRRHFTTAPRMQVKKYTEDHEWIELDESGKIGTPH